MSDNENKFLEEIQRCVEQTQNIGKILDTVSSESKAIKTTINRHEHGISITRYQKHFQHLLGVTIKGSEEWVPMRHEQWSFGAKLFDIIDSKYDVVSPSLPIDGDIDD